jgi:hypothetical protein
MKRVDLPIPNGDVPVRKLLVYQMVLITDANEYSYNIRTVRKYVYFQYVHTQTVKRTHTATWLLKLPASRMVINPSDGNLTLTRYGND